MTATHLKEPEFVPAPKTVITAVAPESSVRSAQPEGITKRPAGTNAVPEEQHVPFLLVAARAPFLGMIKLYQKTISLDHGPLSQFFSYGFCRYEPSCSQYTYEAIEKRGIFVGILLGSWRILRCNPFSHGGIDPVPEKGFRRTTAKR